MGRPLIDITGQRFGEWTVLGLSDQKINNRPVWECVCSCGRKKVVPGGDLRGGRTRRCRECSQEKRISETRIDITGLTYGKWTVLRYSHNEKTNTYWMCRCVCGTEKPVQGTALRGGFSTQCANCRHRSYRKP